MSKKQIGLYIHIPFCIKKCLYCDFLSCPGTADEISYYIRNLIKEIKAYEPISKLYTVKTIYLGGGTPSILNEDEITEIINCIYKYYDVDSDAEITIEINPGTTTEKKLFHYKSLGINRISIGLQSANNDELKTLGRIHTFEDFENSYYLARKAGFENINIDVMSGIPNQTITSYSETLRNVIDLKPEHISSYSLQLEEGTPFFEKYTSINYKFELPSEKTDRDMYKHTKTFLNNAGYERYEISNYSLPGYKSRHNVGYWKLVDYIGLGLGASSYFEGKRFSNCSNMDEYTAGVMNAYNRLSSYQIQSDKEKMEEYMFLGLRLTNGISINDFEDTFNDKFEDIYGDVVKKLYELKMIRFEDDNMMLTDEGIDVSNIVLSKFLLG